MLKRSLIVLFVSAVFSIAAWADAQSDADLSTRTTAEVFMDHLQCRLEGDIEKDIRRNYSPEVEFVTNYGNFKGHDGVRKSAGILKKLVPSRNYRMDSLLFRGDVAFEEWSVKEDTFEVNNGIDAFVIKDGKILVQTIHYVVTDVKK